MHANTWIVPNLDTADTEIPSEHMMCWAWAKFQQSACLTEMSNHTAYAGAKLTKYSNTTTNKSSARHSSSFACMAFAFAAEIYLKLSVANTTSRGLKTTEDIQINDHKTNYVTSALLLTTERYRK